MDSESDFANSLADTDEPDSLRDIELSSNPDEMLDEVSSSSELESLPGDSLTEHLDSPEDINPLSPVATEEQQPPAIDEMDPTQEINPPNHEQPTMNIEQRDFELPMPYLAQQLDISQNPQLFAQSSSLLAAQTSDGPPHLPQFPAAPQTQYMPYPQQTLPYYQPVDISQIYGYPPHFVYPHYVPQTYDQQSRSVSQHHAILNYEHRDRKFRIKDLGSINGTFVNESRIPEEEFFPLEGTDTIRFGYDSTIYHMEQQVDDPQSTHQGETADGDHSPPPIEGSSVWASREEGQVAGFAECPGCIAEQEIHHTCTSHEECNGHTPSTGSSHSVPVPPHIHSIQATGTSAQNRTYPNWQDPAYHYEYPYSVNGQSEIELIIGPESEHLTGVQSPDGASGSLPRTFISHFEPTSADGKTHVIHEPKPIRPAVHVVRHIYHPPHPPGHPPVHPHHAHGGGVRFVHTRARYPVSYISAYNANPYGAYPHGPRLQKSASQDSGAAAYVSQAYQVVTEQSKICDNNNKSTSPYTIKTTLPSNSTTVTVNPANSGATTVAKSTSNSAVVIDLHIAAPTGFREIQSHTESQSKSPAESKSSDFERDSLSLSEIPTREENNSTSSPKVESEISVSSPVKPLSNPGSPQLPRQDQRRSVGGKEGELHTVNKGTPLYGQPSWWGEEGGDHYKYPHTSTLTEKDKSASNGLERPTTLTLDNQGSMHKSISAPTNMATSPDKYTTNYMEIPHSDPAPVTQNGEKNGLHTPPERDSGPGEQPQAADSSFNRSNTAFTVDFGDDDTEPKGKDSRPIGEFMPSGLRRSFRQREEKIKEMQERKKEDTVAKEQQATASPSMSPARQRKADQWNNGSRVIRKHSLSPRRSGYHSDGHNSNLSSDNEDHSIRSESYSSNARAKRIRQNGRSVSVTEKYSTKTTTSRSSKKTTPESHKTPIERRTKTPPADKAKRSVVTPDPGYLINKMFVSQSSARELKEINLVHDATEYELYREAKTFNKLSKTPAKPNKSAGEPTVRKSRVWPKVEDDDDNLSETGTYTIKTEKQVQEIEDARKSIDQVFGVENQELEVDLGIPVIDNGLHGSDDNYSPRDEVGPDVLNSMEANIGNTPRDIDDADFEEDGNDVLGSPTQRKSQWASARSKSLSDNEYSDRGIHSVTPRRQRVGTGRKLPSPPVNKLRTTHDSEITDTHVDTDSPGRHRATVTFDSGKGGTFTISFDAPQREATFTKTEAEVAEDMYGGDMAEDEVSTEQMSTARSVVSVDRDMLLNETSQAMREEYQKQSQKKKIVIVNKDDTQNLPVSREELLIPIKDIVGSDSDSSSEAVVRTRYEPKAPAKTTTPRNKIIRSKSTPAEIKPVPQRAKSIERKPVTRSKEVTQRVITSNTSTTTTKMNSRTSSSSSNRSKASVSRSTSESESASIISSDYSETTSPRLQRKSSGGKGTVMVTRTNRTFALRRQKTEGAAADSDASTLTPRSSRPNSATSAPGSPKISSRTSSRSRSTSRTRPLSAQDMNRSTGSDNLGQRIVDRSRENSRVSKSTGSRDISGSRGTTPRSTNKTPSSSAPSSKNSTPATTPRGKSETRSRANSQRSNSAASGLLASGNKSNPGSRSNSPRTQEFNAWKRRKSYDPRQAVAEAKAKKDQRSKSTGIESDKKVRTVSSSEGVEHDDGYGERSRTDDIIKLSTEIYQNLAAMSRETDNEEADILMTSYEAYGSRLGSNSNRSAFSSVTNLKSPQPDSPPAHQRSNDKHPNYNHHDSSEDNEEDDDQHNNNMLNHLNQEKNESYNTIILRSIYEISNRVKSKTDALMDKLKRSHDLRGSPVTTNLNLEGDSPGLQELAGILTNLRATEQHLQVIDKALFPCPKATGPVRDNKHLRELERIRSELADFRPIERPARTWGSAMHKQKSDDSDKSEPFTGEDYW